MVLKLFQKIYILFKNIEEVHISESINTTHKVLNIISRFRNLN